MLQSLDAKHTLFGEIAEDEDGIITKLNAAIVDAKERPLQNIRIRRTVVLDDPFPDPEGMEAILPERSPEPVYEFGDRLEEDWKPAEDSRCGPEYQRIGAMLPVPRWNCKDAFWLCGPHVRIFLNTLSNSVPHFFVQD